MELSRSDSVLRKKPIIVSHDLPHEKHAATFQIQEDVMEHLLVLDVIRVVQR